MPAQQPPAVEIADLSFRYSGAEQFALEGVALSVNQGERLGILGPNGGGKSTLLKIILGLVTGYQGTVKVMGLPPTQARRTGLIGYVPQRAEVEIGMPVSVRTLAGLAASWKLNPLLPVPAHVRTNVQRVLDLVGASAFADKPIGALSGGQLQRAMIARALACEPKILILDEPTVGIDAPGQAKFAELLTTLHRELKITILTVSHDLRAIAAGSDRVACLARRLHFHDSPNGLTPAVLSELFSHELVGMHVHVHSSSEPCPLDHPAGAGTTSVQLGISASRTRKAADAEGGGA